MKIVFRTDASLQIGTGHVMRCLTLANALRERDAECRFVCREHPGNLIELIRDNGFEAFALPLQNDDTKEAKPDNGPQPAHADWVGGDWTSDAEATVTALDGHIQDWLIVDHYGLDARWESALRSHCRKLMVIDDLADRQHDCDLLLDQNLVADMDHRYDGKLPDNCGTMLGPDYALLQPQYAQLHPRTPPREGAVKRIFVYFGGADTGNLTGLAVSAFLSLDRDDIVMDVVINPYGSHLEAIREQIQGQHIALHAGLPSLAPLMVKADLAIGGGGATSWERCCLGLPSLVVTLAENQKSIAAELDRLSFIRWLGHKDGVDQEVIKQALREIMEQGVAALWSRKCQRLVDGRGADRVCDHLLVQGGVLLVARPARLADEAILLAWANDFVVRQNAFSTDAIDLETHRSWFHKRLGDFPHCRIYVVETENGLPIGQVRFEQKGGNWVIDYSIDARFRGRKLGQPLLSTAIKTLRADIDDSVSLVGQVKASNAASLRLFESLGFQMGAKTSGNFQYMLLLE